MPQNYNLPITDDTTDAKVALTSIVPDAIEAVRTGFSGATEPNAKVAYQYWIDTTDSRLKRRSADGLSWVDLGPIFGRGACQIQAPLPGVLDQTRSVVFSAPRDGKVLRIHVISDTASAATADDANTYSIQATNLVTTNELFSTPPLESQSPITAVSAWIETPDQNQAILEGELVEVTIDVIGSGDGLDTANCKVQVEFELAS